MRAGRTPEGDGDPQGRMLGRYKVLGRIAVGGMSDVYAADECVLGEPIRRVAIKLVRNRRDDGAADPETERRFALEGRTLLRLDHPNLCHSYDLGKIGDRFFIAMEWIDGVSLHQLLAEMNGRGEHISFVHAAALLAQVAAGLGHAHTARGPDDEVHAVVHGDVNPSNIMLRYDGVVKLIDFGIAQALGSSALAESGSVLGKLSYMAPEQILGEELDPRTDVFALGVCLYELLTERRLFRRATDRETCRAIVQSPTPSLRSISPNLPETLELIAQKALRKDKEARFATAADMQAALEDFLIANHYPTGARPLAALMQRLYPERGRRAPQSKSQQLPIESEVDADTEAHPVSRVVASKVPSERPSTSHIPPARDSVIAGAGFGGAPYDDDEPTMVYTAESIGQNAASSAQPRRAQISVAPPAWFKSADSLPRTVLYALGAGLVALLFAFAVRTLTSRTPTTVSLPQQLPAAPAAAPPAPRPVVTELGESANEGQRQPADGASVVREPLAKPPTSPRKGAP